MGSIELAAFGAGIVLGSLLLVAVAVVWIRKQIFGIGGSVMCLCGVMLVGLTVLRTVQFDISADGFSGRFEQFERRVAELDQKVDNVDTSLNTIVTTNAQLARDVGTLNQAVTSTSVQFRAFTDELARSRTVAPDRAANFRDSVIVPQFDANVFEERARQLERSRIR